MKKLIALCLLAICITSTQVTFSNLLGFFNNTLDGNHDGFSTLEEFVQYFRFMEPEHNLTKEDLVDTF